MSTRPLVMPIVVGIAFMACRSSEPTSVDSSSVQVPPNPVTYPSVAVTPQSATLARGTQLSLFVALKGFVNDGSDLAPIWSSSDSRVVQVSRLTVNNASSSSIPSAIAYAEGVGSATITVWVAGRSASVEVTVTDATKNNR